MSIIGLWVGLLKLGCNLSDRCFVVHVRTTASVQRSRMAAQSTGIVSVFEASSEIVLDALA